MQAIARSDSPSAAPPAAAQADPARRAGLRRRAPPRLRVVLALGFGTLGFLATLALAALVSREATRRLEAEVGGQLAEIAGQMARSLDLGMFERWRDIQIAAASDSLRDPGAGTAAKRALMERMQATYPAYSIIGLIDADGRVAVTSTGALEGADVSGRDYFRAGRAAPFVGDVHPAKLLQAVLTPRGPGSNEAAPREPLRLVDVAAPVRAADGRLVGVLAAHLDWTWARDMARTLEGSLRGHREGAEILILSRDGAVLLGPPGLQGDSLPSPQPRSLTQPLPQAVPAGGRPLDRQGTSRVGPWPDGAAYLSAQARTAGYRDYPGLGWQVVVRQSADRALASATALRANILVAGSAVALAAALLAWLLAGLIARPLRELAGAAGALGRGQPLPVLPRSLVREGTMIAEALEAAADELARRAQAHRLLIDELNHRVKNTLATVQSMAAQSLKNLGGGAAAGRDAFEARLLALSRAHDVLTRESWTSAGLRGIADQALRPFLGETALGETALGETALGETALGETALGETADDATPRITLAGPDLRLPPEGALALTMILHELCTNAVKHGALSVPGGRAALSWVRETDAGAPTLRITWRERGGPPVAPPARSGFGTRLLERGLAGRNTASLAYEAAGFVYVAACPLPAPPAEADATPPRPRPA
ncbi:HAMP domain-containing protein [Methylobacterium mesophilicum SR1.6/6]|uniref:histidine kinase n=1 Tax=Methylobacterium mesophilicum SR1.6/6 TaxID=908290 RepID=A0A6B9FF54_9HYPH|nr:sensor histidine kinase [Methylobacterium mesophilicum]QGY00766.1 HAMP domain-containing protein [Methylobacterium mesophilicum SR1.6/6]